MKQFFHVMISHDFTNHQSQITNYQSQITNHFHINKFTIKINKF
ncbi:Uncharacterized protein dnm_033450 [Desulfonema magnum]|uniref:Uncharacterized protein n=1 Tax=Desulfonema magnum TaxID=45655 RepID=A0A975GN25_9BACT|nr:Uncharacterized protein dnm_033450 [Desulfonema magnum]